MWWMFAGGLFAGLVIGFGLGAIFGVWLTGDDESSDRNKSNSYGLE